MKCFESCSYMQHIASPGNPHLEGGHDRKASLFSHHCNLSATCRPLLSLLTQSFRFCSISPSHNIEGLQPIPSHHIHYFRTPSTDFLLTCPRHFSTFHPFYHSIVHSFSFLCHHKPLIYLFIPHSQLYSHSTSCC